MPPSKRANALAALPTAKEAAAHLKRTGEPRMAAAVADVIAYAEYASAVRERAAEREAAAAPSYSLRIDRALRDHVHATGAASGTEIPSAVTSRLEAFVAGTWTPQPSGRAARGTSPEKADLNVRVPKDLFDRVDALAKDPAAIAERGFKLTARQVAIAALTEAFPLPEPAEAE